MDVLEVSSNEYAARVTEPFTLFDTVEFAALNAHKVETVKYLIFNDGKDRFAMIGGIRESGLCFPFSASFCCLTKIDSNDKIEHYYEAVNALKEYARKQKLKKIEILLPPAYYDVSSITKFYNALICNGFVQQSADVNFEYYLYKFGAEYPKIIPYNSRKSLNIAIRNQLSFEKTNDYAAVYSVIKNNRESKNYSLKMSLDDVLKTADVIPTDLFLVKDVSGNNIASALVHHIREGIVRVVYWGNIAGSDKLCSMNFISYNVFKYYHDHGKIIVDIGPSTIDGVPNYGLCNFKEGIGCDCSIKPNLILFLDES